MGLWFSSQVLKGILVPEPHSYALIARWFATELKNLQEFFVINPQQKKAERLKLTKITSDSCRWFPAADLWKEYNGHDIKSLR